MNYHNANGMKWRDPKDYPHYKIIANIFEKAKKKAWAQIMNDPSVVTLRDIERNRKVENVSANKETYEKIIGVRK